MLCFVIVFPCKCMKILNIKLFEMEVKANQRDKDA